jgi:hypothetical protein
MALDINALYSSLTDNELAGLSTAREIGAAFPITRGGTVYNFLPDGNIETTTPNDIQGGRTGATLGLFLALAKLLLIHTTTNRLVRQAAVNCLVKHYLVPVLALCLALPDLV